MSIREEVLARVGVEPTGEAYNSFKVENGGKPPNPMVNIGAIEIASMIDDPDFSRTLAHFSKYAGRDLHVDLEVFKSEASTGHKNIALAHLLSEGNQLCDTVENSTRKYFKQCSVAVTAKDLATIAATLANGGVNPITNNIVTRTSHVTQVLSVMSMCGMYNYTGGWLSEVGFPAKSGVGGGICCVVPGVLGIGVFSPLVDKFACSVRGLRICREFSERLGLSMFQPFGMMLAASYSQAAIKTGQIKEIQGMPYVVISLDGTMSIVAVEGVARQFVELHFNQAKVLVLHISHRSRVDTAGLVLISVFNQRMRDTGRCLIICMQNSPSALKLQECIGSAHFIEDLDKLPKRLAELGLVLATQF
jgi:glutaminase